MKEWNTYKLKDICLKITDGSHFSPTACVDGYPMFSVKDMEEYGFNYSSCKRISAEDFNTLKANDCIPQKGDVLVAKDGSFLKQIFVCNETREEAILSSIAIFRPNPEYVIPEFLCYILKSPKVYNYIAQNCVSGSALPRIVLKAFKDVEVSIPSIDIQKWIISKLTHIDQKIQLNRQINDNLEQQARELFKSWFINSPQESWKEKSLSDYFNVITGKKDANYSTPEGAYPFFTCSQDILKAPSYSFDGHAILVAGNGDFNVKRYIGKFEAYQRTYVLIPHEEKFHAFLYLMIDYYLPEITGGSRGSVIKFITKGNIANFRFRVPQNNIDDQLKKLNDIYKIIDCNLEESSRLTKMRDTLLPKLMSGELKINEIDC